MYYCYTYNNNVNKKEFGENIVYFIIQKVDVLKKNKNNNN